jgi:hypothetical protein
MTCLRRSLRLRGSLCVRRRRLPVAVVLVCLGCVVGAPSPASARPLIDAPSGLLSAASQPCVLYSCAANPQPHDDWVRSTGLLASSYCDLYVCSPMDLVPDHGFDDNLFPVNPDWADFNQNGHVPDPSAVCDDFRDQPLSASCTHDPVTFDGPGLGTLADNTCLFGRSPLLSFHGHVNYEPATYAGTLFWESHSAPGTDDEYSISLATVGGAGATVAKPSGINLEFDSDETVDHFDDVPWWKQFHDAVDAADEAAARLALFSGANPPFHPSAAFKLQLQHAADATKHAVEGFINGHVGVATGQIGLDTAHDVAAESHPVYALAVQSDRNAAVSGGTDRWALFARSWGNEGFCSDDNHTLPRGPLTVRIPWQDGATGVAAGTRADPAQGVRVSRSNLSHSGPAAAPVSVSVLPGEGVLLTFDLSADPTEDPLYWGTIDLKWTFGEPGGTATFASTHAGRLGASAPAAKSRRKHDRGERFDVEALVARLWRRLPRAVRSRALARLPHPHVRARGKPVKVVLAPPPVSPLRRVQSFVAPVRDRAIRKRGRAEYAALCAAYKHHVPRYPKMCRRARRR